MYRLRFVGGGEVPSWLHRHLPSIEAAQELAEANFGGPLWWRTPTEGTHPNPGQFAGTYYIENEESDVSYTNPTREEIDAEVDVEAQLRDQMAREAAPDLQTLIQNQIQEAIGHLVTQEAVGKEESWDEVLARVDPADSDAALAMLDFLLKTGRLGRVGVLDGGQGYLFMYQEPKGSTKQGYKPGATQGDRIVDEAIDAQRAAGNTPRKRGMCQHCLSIVVEVGDRIEADLPPELAGQGDATACNNSPDGKHSMA